MSPKAFLDGICSFGSQESSEFGMQSLKLSFLCLIFTRLLKTCAIVPYYKFVMKALAKFDVTYGP